MEADHIRPFLIGIGGGQLSGKYFLLEKISNSIGSGIKICKISIVKL